MSANAASLPCPICLHTGVFDSVKSLRDKLIFVSTNTLLCPVCQEEVTGLDKLTIHLFTHVKLDSVKRTRKKCTEDNLESSKDIKEQQKQGNHNIVIPKKKTLPSSCATPIKYVKIYPKLPVVSSNPVSITESVEKPCGNTHKVECKQSSNQTSVTLAQSEETQKNTTCNICGLQFVDENILKIHRGLIHNIEEHTEQNFTRYHCHLCPKNFKMRGSLMVHLRVAHFGFPSTKSNDEHNVEIVKTPQIEGFKKEENNNVERNENKQWQCDVCRKCFTTKYFLKKHKRLHTGETPYACSQCNKSFTFQQSYHKHLLYHNDEKPHTCNYCGRAFKELSTLHNHQRIHTGEKPFSCETCGKSFRQRVSYLVHRRIHTGAMPYRCTACDKSFRYKVSQRTHKCQAQPPGTVIRQTGDLVEKLLKKNDDSVYTTDVQVPAMHNNQNHYCIDVSKDNAELALTGAKLSLEDMVAENFTFIPDTYYEESNSNCVTRYENREMDRNIAELIDSISHVDKNMPSPSEIFKNLNLTQEDDLHDIEL